MWDHIVTWKKPKQPPEWMDRAQYDAMPAEMRIREVKRRIAVKGFRVRHLILATTLLDAELYPAAELAQAFRVRWHAEVDLRSIKVAMKLDVLRCKTPAMVRSEFWMHLLGYNLVRTVMAQAADRSDRHTFSGPKLGSVATDILGVSGREMIRALIAGQDDPSALADLARRRLRNKLPEWREALRGHLTEHHRFMLRQLMDHLAYLDGQIAAFEQRIEELMRPFQEAIERLMTMPGVGKRTAQNVLAEIGTDMSRFPTDQHLASWAAMCPGNRESAGKRQSGRTRHGNRWLRTALVQAAWAASRSKKTYLSAQYRRLAGRRGKKRAIVALGHTMLVMMYHMLKDGVDYHELGHDYLDKLQPRRLTHYLVKRLESLGHEVTLRPVDRAA